MKLVRIVRRETSGLRHRKKVLGQKGKKAKNGKHREVYYRHNLIPGGSSHAKGKGRLPSAFGAN